jgi:hypothetical protein
MIHIVLGKQGSGKTLYTVYQAIAYYGRGKTIYSNVHLNGIKYKKLDYNDIINCKLENAFVFIDEIHQLLPARRSLSKTSVTICDSFLSMVRKKDVDLWGTTQTLRKVDIRMREEADYIHSCKKFAFINDEFIKCAGFEKFDISIPVLITAEVLECDSGNIINSTIVANKYYKKYDTNQIIQITGLN